MSTGDSYKSLLYLKSCYFYSYFFIVKDLVPVSLNILTPILRIGDQVLTFDVFWPKHLQEVRSTVYIHVQSI